jgi:hypothetical protein
MRYRSSGGERTEPIWCIPSPDEIAAIEVELALHAGARILEETDQHAARETGSA